MAKDAHCPHTYPFLDKIFAAENTQLLYHSLEDRLNVKLRLLPWPGSTKIVGNSCKAQFKGSHHDGPWCIILSLAGVLFAYCRGILDNLTKPVYTTNAALYGSQH